MTSRPKHIPMRTCVACGRTTDKGDLVRVVRTPEGDITVDLSGKLSGRGAYVCRETTCWQRGLEKERIAHSLKTTLSPDQRNALLAASRDVAGVVS